jgi:uncharacterized protein YecE (DUF72 family)
VKVWIGTSGWQYGSWKGPFYPEKLPQREWLPFYAARFPTVEVNNTFYALPKETTFDRWREVTPTDFRIVVKASRYITHIRRLRNAKDSVDLFWSRATRLGPKLGPVLFQTPPTFPVDTGLLGEFLSILPKGIRPAFEFREASWFTDEVYGLLGRAGAAWVLADRPNARVPDIVTGGWSYVRFHQGRPMHPGYPREKLHRWAERIAAMPVDEVYAFFNNDHLAAAPADAATLADLLAELGCEVIRPAA